MTPNPSCDSESCGVCLWLSDYWFNLGQLKLEFTSGPITGYWILDAVSTNLEPGSCLQWEVSDRSNASDSCNLFSSYSGSLVFYCEQTDYSAIPMKLSSAIGGASCAFGGSGVGPDSASCTGPAPGQPYGTLSVVFTRPLEELLPNGCDPCGFPGNVVMTISLYP